MDLQIPNLANARCELLSCCGWFDSKDKKLVDWIRGVIHASDGEAFNYKLDSYTYAMLDLDIPKGSEEAEETEGVHFHINLATSSYFDNKPPKLDDKAPSFYEAVEKFCGVEMQVTARAYFNLRIGEAPPLIKLTERIKSNVGDFEASLSSGEFRVKGGTVKSLFWKFSEDGKDVRIQLVGKYNVVVKDDYLETLFSNLDRVFKSLFPEDRSNANTT